MKLTQQLEPLYHEGLPINDPKARIPIRGILLSGSRLAS
jgi:hypothetical protein